MNISFNLYGEYISTKVYSYSGLLSTRKSSALLNKKIKFSIKGALSGLRQFLAIENPLKMMKKAFYFTSKPLSALKIFKFLSSLFGHVVKQPD